MEINEQIRLWQEQYAQDQENLYKSIVIRTLFDLGHKYIASEGRDGKGTVLDLGSGMGYHLKFEEISSDRRYICLDNDPKMLSAINLPHVTKIVGSCSKIPLDDSSIDVVIASHILEHLPSLETDLNEIKRVLKKNGKLLVVLPCDPGLFWKMLTLFTPSRWRLKKIGIDYDVVMRHEHVNTFSSCIEMLAKQFTVTKQRFYPFLVPNYHLNLLNCLTLSPK